MSGICTAIDCDRAIVAKGLCLKHYKAARRPKRQTVSERFWSRVVQDGDCWLWSAGLSQAGYGYIGVGQRRLLAHRFAYEEMVGEIPAGLQLDHLCRRPSCVNPDHLEPVTPYVNNMRSDSLAARRARMTECPRGHALTPDNVYSRPDRVNARMCRKCCQLREQRRVRRRSA